MTPDFNSGIALGNAIIHQPTMWKCHEKHLRSALTACSICSPTKLAARRRFETIRWRTACPARIAGATTSTTRKARAGFYDCRDCKAHFSVRTDTVFEKSHVKLHKWIYAIYLLMTSRKRISSQQLSKEIGMTQKTTWFILHRLRLACGGDMEKLSGIVDIGETYIGGREKNRHSGSKLDKGRGPAGKQAVLGMKERGGRVKATPIQRVDVGTINREIGGSVEFGATVYTDEHPSYDRLHARSGQALGPQKEYVREWRTPTA